MDREIRRIRLFMRNTHRRGGTSTLEGVFTPFLPLIDNGETTDAPQTRPRVLFARAPAPLIRIYPPGEALNCIVLS